jgi:hypothetical protein
LGGIYDDRPLRRLEKIILGVSRSSPMSRICRQRGELLAAPLEMQAATNSIKFWNMVAMLPFGAAFAPAASAPSKKVDS